VIFIHYSDDRTELIWRLYETPEAAMVRGKKIPQQKSGVRGHAYALADKVWPELTRQSSSFMTKIAYAKRKSTIPGRQQSILCVCDFDGSHEEELITKPSIYVGLYWYNNSELPLLLYYDFTRSHIRLMAVGMDRQKKILLNCEGTCVGISLSKDRNQAVYGQSGDIWYYQFDQEHKKGHRIKLISNGGKNTCPTLLANGDIIFCSDSKKLRQSHAQVHGPQIYRYHAKDKAIEPITQGGYCVGPAYCDGTQAIAYSKRIHGIMQLFVYNIKTKEHTQLTFDGGNKIDCCWSPCGNYLLFCYQKDNISRIVAMHAVLKERYFVTSTRDYCTSPAWSVPYTELPVL
jgi:Tol biopolymer transport system component